MRYDAKDGKLYVSVREMVTVARREYAATLSEEEEPSMRPAPGTGAGEIALETEFPYGEYTAHLTGHCDGDGQEELRLTVTLPAAPRRAREQTRAQARGEGYVLGYMYCEQRDLPAVTLRVGYLDEKSGEVVWQTEALTRKRAESFFRRCTERLALYAVPEVERVTRRLPTLRSLAFPYPTVRPGQEEFMRRAYRSMARGGTLYATAPTGTGKTVSALYPALRTLGDGRAEKVFYLTPKGTTTAAAVECLDRFAASGALVRAVVLAARERLCPNGLACRAGGKCPYAQENRVGQAALSLYGQGHTTVTPALLREAGQKERVCPHELSLTYSELCDVVIGDVNYLFDPAVAIKRYFTEGGRYLFLLDEAHNLADRVRDIYSAEIGEETIVSLPGNLGVASPLRAHAAKFAGDLHRLLLPYLKDEVREDENGRPVAAVHTRTLPAALYGLVGGFADACEAEIQAQYAARDEERGARLSALRGYTRAIQKFRGVLEAYDDRFETFLFLQEKKVKIKLFCLDPSQIIASRVAKGHAALFFSATLTPLPYYRAVLGGDSHAETLEVESPFDPSQLSVSIMDKISTRLSEREDTAGAVCRVIAATISPRRGNYMVFTPSFAYNEAICAAFRRRYPKLHVLEQKRNFSPREREEFLAAFRDENDKNYLVGFCVMGGIYAEGIDLYGESLIGAVVLGIGMPGLSFEREAMCAYYDEKYEEGRAYAYLYPGMNRVLQAAGRVIRRESDRGVIVLVDDRFNDPLYRKIIPTLWHGLKFVSDAKGLHLLLTRFWEGADGDTAR